MVSIPGHGATREQDINLPGRQLMTHPDSVAALVPAAVLEFEFLGAPAKPSVQSTQPQCNAHLNTLGVAGIDEDQRQDTVVHQILAVNPRDALGQHDVHAKIADRQSRLLTAGSLPVVTAAHDRAPTTIRPLTGAIHIGVARDTETLLMHRVAGAVPGRREPQPEALGGAAQQQVIITVPTVTLDQQMTDIGDHDLGTDVVHAHRFELERTQRTSSVLPQNLIDP